MMRLPDHLRTARLSLRPIEARDEAAVLAGLNDLSVAGWLGRVPHPYGRDDFLFFLNSFARPGETFVVEDGDGFAGIVTSNDELGYWFLPRAQGLGYATETGRAVLSSWFAAGGGDVVSGYFEGNSASARVLEKLGFVETGRDDILCQPLRKMRPHVSLRLTAEGFRQGV
jgi:RimJ/RimL family protein N-acetyltransferase